MINNRITLTRNQEIKHNKNMLEILIREFNRKLTSQKRHKNQI